jgi:hypothetical protein
MTDAQGALDGLLRPAASIDWANVREARRASSALFDRVVAAEGLLSAVVGEVIAARGTGGGCESYPAMDKLVLWASPDRTLRLRLHVFYPGYYDRPHNHRWSFLSRVLSGGYLHALYGTETEVLAEAQAGHAPRVRFAHEEPAGSEYFLDHSLVHSLSADQVTVSLMLRGPSVKDGYFTLDGPATDRIVWSSGAAQEGRTDLAAKAMGEEGFTRAEGVLARIGLR